MQVGRYIIGTGLCVVAALVYCTNYAVASAHADLINTWPTDVGRVGEAVNQYSSGWLTTLSVLSLLAGIAFIVLAERGRAEG
jgi:drug/metabolite transporter (DMT)-like permease